MSSKFIVPLKLLEINATPAFTVSDWHNLYYKAGYLKTYKTSEKDVVLDRPLDGFNPTVCTAIVATDTVLEAFEKVQCQISAIPPLEWGNITGTLSNQLDLDAVLQSKYDVSNPAGYITSSALSPYLTSASASTLYVPLSRQLTINGVTYDLSANRSWTISASGGSVQTLGTSLYSTSPAAGPNFSNTNGIFLGGSSGANASNASYSNFIGRNTGLNATGSSYSNFIGDQAGSGAQDSFNSNFIGRNAGLNASNSRGSTFMGPFAGTGHTGAFEAVFIGNGAGASGGFYGNSFGCLKSLFVGAQCGEGAKNVTDSLAIGSSALRGASSNVECISMSVGSMEVASSNTRYYAFGSYSGRLSSNSIDVIGIGTFATAVSNNANNLIGIGNYAGYNNDNVSNTIALGNYAAVNNTLSGQFIVSPNTIPIFIDAVQAQTALAAGISGNRYFWLDQSTLTNGSYTLKVFVP
jgi:hypothetical protein